MRHVLACLAVLSASALLAAPPVVTGPETVTGEECSWVEIPVRVDGGKGLQVVSLTPGLSVFPPDKLKEPTPIVSGKAGFYDVLIYSGNADGPSAPYRVRVQLVGKIVPPGPNPPVPVPPVPVPPAPVNPHLTALTAAYALELAPDRRERVRALAGVMREGSAWSLDAGVTDNGQLAAKVNGRSNEQVGRDNLKAVRKAVGDQFRGIFPAELVTLTPELRKKFSENYRLVAEALDSLAP